MNTNERASRLRQRVRRRITWGSLSVEMAIVAPVLILLLFGTIEMGLLFKDALTLSSAAREGVRVAAVGSTVQDINNRITAAAATLHTENLSVEINKRMYAGGSWSSWTNLGDTGDGLGNDALRGEQIRITLTYPHELVTGGLFSGLVTAPGESAVNLSSSMVMMRE